jgi:two-component system, sensor histidine kinase and response regulator
VANEESGRRFRVLVADDEEGMRLAVERALRGFTVAVEETGETIGMEVVLVDSGEAAIEEIERCRPDIVLLDHKMGGMSGLEVLSWLEERDIDLLAVMITAYASIETAISATRKGAYDFLAKPFTPGELRVSVRQAVTHLATLRKTRELEEEKRRVRFQFISVLAHELKAPLGAIEGYLYVLQDKNAVSDPAVYDRIVDRCLIRLVGMRKLIFDLLDLTRLESGTHRRDLIECDLQDAVTASIETMTPDADRRGISFLREGPGGPVVLSADQAELGIILNNLISNAVKYNREGGSITVRLQDLPDQVVISVSDTGIGMSEEELGKLFQEFTRIRNAKTKDILGSGLGLTILQKLAALYGGRVTVESTPDVGSSFTVNLMRSTTAG